MGLIGQIVSIFSNGPAIQNLENFDMVIQMKGGGLLLPIVCSKHLDDTDDILNLLRTKVENYTDMIDLEEFKKDFPRRDYIQIELNCIKKPDQRILEELEVFGKKYSDRAIKFSWRS